MVLSSGNLKVHWLLRRPARMELFKVGDAGLHTKMVRESMRDRRIGVYVHIPYCRTTCPFCPYFKTVLRSRDEVEKYLRAVVGEIDFYGRLLEGGGYEVVEIHVGGGTPSLVPASFFKELYEKLSEYFTLKTNIGIEANPEDLTSSEYAGELYKNEVGEVSIGAQSFNEKVLKALGRKHTVEDNVRAVENAVKAGFKWVNVDLMFLPPSIRGYVEISPEEGLTIFEDDLERALELGAHQITFYPTIIPRHSPGFKLVEQGRIAQDERLVDKFVERALDFAENKKLRLVRVYSISREQYEYATVNLEMVGPLLGLGAGAWSNTGLYQYINVHDVQSYVRLVNEGRPPAVYYRSLEKSTIAWRVLFDQLSSGVVKTRLFNELGVEKIPYSIRAFLELATLAGLLEKRGGDYYLTRKGVVEVYKSVINYVVEIPVKATMILEKYSRQESMPDKIVV